STGTSGLLPGSQLAGGSTSYFAQTQLVSLSSGVMGTLSIGSLGNLPAVSLSTGTLAGSLLSPTQMVAVSLSSQTLASSILPPTNLAAISLSSQTIGLLPGAQLAGGSTSYFGQTQLVSLSTGTSGLLPGSQLAGGSTSYFAQTQLV